MVDGSTDSPVLVRLAVAAFLRGVVAAPVVFRRGDDRALFAGAGVNSSSSSSSSCFRLATLFSMSELLSSSTTTRRRVAVRRDGRSGDTDIATAIPSLSVRQLLAVSVRRWSLDVDTSKVNRVNKAQTRRGKCPRGKYACDTTIFQPIKGSILISKSSIRAAVYRATSDARTSCLSRTISST